MTTFRSTSRRLLPGHGLTSRFSGTTSLPGVDPAERRARRYSWTRYRAEQRALFGRRDSLGLAGAALALALMISAVLAPRPNVLDTTGTTAVANPTAPLVDATPPPSADAITLRG